MSTSTPRSQSQLRQEISFEIKRLYKNKNQYTSAERPKTPGRMLDIIDFNLNGRNRYLKINQPINKPSNPEGALLTETRDWTRFKNSKLNKYERLEQDDYTPKRFVFEYEKDDESTEYEFDDDDDVIDGKKLGGLKKKTKKKQNINETGKSADFKNIGKKKKEKSNSNETGSETSDEKPEKVTKTRSSTFKTLNSDKNKVKSGDKNSNSNTKKNDDAISPNIKKTHTDEDADEIRVNEAYKLIESILKDKKKIESGKDDGKLHIKADEMNNKEKERYLKKKNIQMNKSTVDTDEQHKIAKKPEKNKNYIQNDMASVGTQTPRSVGTQTPLFHNDPLQTMPDADSYLKRFIDDVQKIDDYVLKDRESKDVNYKIIQNSDGLLADYGKKNSNKDKDSSNLANNKNKITSNSLGLTMQPEQGINMAIIRDPKNQSAENQQLQKNEVTLLTKNYQNLEDLVNYIENKLIPSDNDYLHLAKLNRLRVLMELSLAMVGRNYFDISTDERNKLEFQANRFHNTYPLPGETQSLQETDEKKLLRMPLKIVKEDGVPKIDISNRYIIDPNAFLKVYTNKLIDHAEDTSGLKFDSITVTIPTNYGTNQREAIKAIVNDATNRTDVKILTRPVAAAVILYNKRLNDLSISSSQQSNDSHKIIFDLTDESIDASVILIKDVKDFQVVSNVGDTSFGLNDINERIVQHILKEKQIRQLKSGALTSRSLSQTLNAHSNLIKDIKYCIATDDKVAIDLSTLNKANGPFPNENKSPDHLIVHKKEISSLVCKDIYDWSIAHIDKAVLQADLKESHIDEIILIGGPDKMPGFEDRLKSLHPKKTITYVPDDELAVGAAIVGRKIKYQQLKVTEILVRSIGIGLYSGIISYLLFRNTALPCIGGCVYSTLVDDQESMVLDVYEGERPHVKFCRYLGEVVILGLEKGLAGRVKIELHLKMNNEGLLDVMANSLSTGKKLDAIIDANPENFQSDEVNEDTEMDPIEAERYKKADYDLVLELEHLDDYLENVTEKYRTHKYSKLITDKIFDTKEWLYRNKRKVTIDDCLRIKGTIKKFLKTVESEK